MKEPSRKVKWYVLPLGVAFVLLLALLAVGLLIKATLNWEIADTLIAASFVGGVVWLAAVSVAYRRVPDVNRPLSRRISDAFGAACNTILTLLITVVVVAVIGGIVGILWFGWKQLL